LNNELEGMWKEVVVAYSRYSPSTRLQLRWPEPPVETGTRGLSWSDVIHFSICRVSHSFYSAVLLESNSVQMSVILPLTVKAIRATNAFGNLTASLLTNTLPIYAVGTASYNRQNEPRTSHRSSVTNPALYPPHHLAWHKRLAP
jgi:hypothetical protein